MLLCRCARPGLATALVAAAMLAACTPALNWREARVDTPNASLLVLLPCKPKEASRTVPLAGQPVALTLQHCDADGTVWAMSHADVAEPARVGPALDALRSAALRNIDATVPGTESPAQVNGQTPHAQALRFDATGRRPDGQPVQLRAAVFSHGTTVWQATVIGAAPPPEAVATYFGALRFAAR